jgi:hypothetical protein
MGFALFIPSRGEVGNANCGTGLTMQLMAQAVPTAAQLPCIEDLPLGWGTEQSSVVKDGASFKVGIGSDLTNAVIVTLVPTCPTDASVETIPVEGGCVTYEVPPGTEANSVPSFDDGGGLRLRIAANSSPRSGRTRISSYAARALLRAVRREELRLID